MIETKIPFTDGMSLDDPTNVAVHFRFEADDDAACEQGCGAYQQMYSFAMARGQQIKSPGTTVNIRVSCNTARREARGCGMGIFQMTSTPHPEQEPAEPPVQSETPGEPTSSGYN